MEAESEGYTSPLKRARLELEDDIFQSIPTPSETKIPTPSVPKSRLTHSYIPIIPNPNGYKYSIPPPTRRTLQETLASHDVPSKIYTAPYYSNYEDAPRRPKEFGGLLFYLKGGTGVTKLQEWEGYSSIPNQGGYLQPVGVGGWEYAGYPPSPKDVKRWRTSNEGRKTMEESGHVVRSQVCPREFSGTTTNLTI